MRQLAGMSSALAHIRTLTSQHQNCAGVAIDVDLSSGVAVYSVLLLDADGMEGRPFVTTADEVGAKRAWHLLARVMRIARFVASPEGGYRVVSATMGALVVRPMQARRSRRVALRRRPSARKNLAAPIRVLRYAGEREIIARN